MEAITGLANILLLFKNTVKLRVIPSVGVPSSSSSFMSRTLSIRFCAVFSALDAKVESADESHQLIFSAVKDINTIF